MGEVFLSSEDLEMNEAAEKNRTETEMNSCSNNNNKNSNNNGSWKMKDGCSSSGAITRCDRFLPGMMMRVLLVEADDSTRQIIAALLRKCSYRVAAVPDGLKAWELLKGRPHDVDLILTEVDLPSISGFALLTLITEHEVCKNIPVIMMSSQDSISTVYKCMMRGAADYLVKPIRRNELSNLWQHVWRRKASTANGPQDESVAQQKIEATSENDAVSNHSNGNTACIQRNEDRIDKGSDAQENLEQIQNEIPTSDRSDLLDDALASYFGPDGNGRMRALGLGMTKTKHSILSERDDNLQALQDKCNKTEADVRIAGDNLSIVEKSSKWHQK